LPRGRSIFGMVAGGGCRCCRRRLSLSRSLITGSRQSAEKLSASSPRGFPTAALPNPGALEGRRAANAGQYSRAPASSSQQQLLSLVDEQFEATAGRHEQPAEAVAPAAPVVRQRVTIGLCPMT